MKKYIIILFIFIFQVYAYAEEHTQIEASSIAKDRFCSYYIDNTGVLWASGKNSSKEYGYDGMLGGGMPYYPEQPVKIMNNVFSVSLRSAIKTDGSLWVWGNENGKIFDKENYHVPFKIDEDVIWVSSNMYHTLYIKDNGDLYGFGDNTFGQLGVPTDESTEDIRKLRPVRITENVKKALAGEKHSIILKSDGSVWVFGNNEYGQLGTGEEALVIENGSPKELREFRKNNTPVNVMNGIQNIFVGEASSFSLDNEGNLWAWGCFTYNIFGCLHILHFKPFIYTENVKTVYPRTGYNLVQKNDGSIWVYGQPDAYKNYQMLFSENIDLPVELKINDVNYFCGTALMDSDALLLTNNGKLFNFNIVYDKPSENSEISVNVNEIAENIHLTGNVSVSKKKNFTDISDKPEEMQKAINALAKAGIISGTSETEFSPDKSITRAEIAALLLRMTGKDKGNDNGGFSDVPTDKWYYGVAGASKEYNIISGYDDNTFRGDDVISKEQLVSLVARVLRNEKTTPLLEYSAEDLKFTDNASISKWAENDITLAFAEKLILNNLTEVFSPQSEMTRGEAAIILYNLYNKI